MFNNIKGDYMIIKFDRNYKRRTSDNMSTVLDRIKQYNGADDMLETHGCVDDFKVDIFGLAKELGIRVKDSDFDEFEKQTKVKEDSVLGAIIDINEEDSLTILLKNSLGKSEFYENMTSVERNDTLRKRRRFTLAHEIAHAYLHISENDARFRFDSRTELDPLTEKDLYDKEEYEANVFAGELLVPQKKLSAICAQMAYPSLNLLCEIFDVSHSVMSARLRHLGMMYVDDYAKA